MSYRIDYLQAGHKIASEETAANTSKEACEIARKGLGERPKADVFRVINNESGAEVCSGRRE
jgi:hypothetical protein